MCGLVGVAGNLFNREIETFKDLLYCSERRGSDATGVASYAVRTQEWRIAKQALPSPVWLESRKNDQVISASADVLLGHTRKATYASKHLWEDAHPFKYGSIIGAHNGSIPYHSLLKLPHRLTGVIDSEELIFNIHKEGIDGIIPKINGAWALSLLDVDNKKLGFVRNAQRPLHISFSKDRSKMYWASESGMLQWCLERNDVETYTPMPIPLKEDVFYEIDLTGNLIADSITERPLKGAEEEKKTCQPAYRGGYGGSQYPALSGPSTPIGGNTTKKEKNITPYDAISRAITGMEYRLLDYDYSRQATWSKNIKGRHRHLVTQLTAARRSRTRLAGTSVALKEDAEIIEKLGMSEAVFREVYAEMGCSYCADKSSDNLVVEGCEHTKSGKIICPVCAADPEVRHDSGLNAEKDEVLECN